MGRDFNIPSMGLLDTNFLVACLIATDRFHRDAREYLRALASAVESGGVRLYTAPRVIEEALWVGCRAFYEANHGAGAFGSLSGDDRLGVLSTHGELLHGMAAKLLSEDAPYKLTPLQTEDMSVAVDIATESAVPITDACLSALALRVCGGNVITNDRHMERIPEITCFSYVPPRPQFTRSP
jgi:predicted nucleic acid-binding protein